MKLIISRLFLVTLFLFITLAADPADSRSPKQSVVITSPDQLDLIDVSTVEKILKPDLIRLQNKKTYKLDGIRVPPVYSQVAMAYLSKKLIGKKIGVYADKYNKAGVSDPYGNGIGNIVLEDATWIQSDMVSRGIAWSFSTPHNRLFARELQKAENIARTARAGFWSNPEYSIKTKENIKKYINSFQLYEGKITYVEPIEDDSILYFGTDGKKEPGLVAAISVQDTINFENRFDPVGWQSRSLRIRGWVESDPALPAPVMRITHLQQVEFLDVPAAAPATAKP